MYEYENAAELVDDPDEIGKDSPRHDSDLSAECVQDMLSAPTGSSSSQPSVSLEPIAEVFTRETCSKELKTKTGFYKNNLLHRIQSELRRFNTAIFIVNCLTSSIVFFFCLMTEANTKRPTAEEMIPIVEDIALDFLKAIERDLEESSEEKLFLSRLLKQIPSQVWFDF